MMFSNEVQEHPTEVQKKIYIDGLRLTPLEVSLNDTEGIDPNLIESCKQYYHFISNMLWDMYRYPKEYVSAVGELEEYLNGRNLNAVKRRNPTQVNRLRSFTYNTTNVYRTYLFNLAKTSELSGDSLIISQEKYANIKKLLKKEMSTQKNPDQKPLERRVEALKKNGFMIEEGDQVVITSLEYPKMFLAMKALADSAAKVKTFGIENFNNCEFRQIFKINIPKYEDVVQTLDNKNKEVCDIIHNHLLSIKAVPSCTTYWKVNYKYRGEQIVQISTDGTDSKILINGVYWWEDLELLNNRLRQKDLEIQKHALRKLNYCNGCSTSHFSGGEVYVLGHRARLCGGVSFRFVNSESRESQFMKELIQIRSEIIEAVKKEKMRTNKANTRTNKAKSSGEIG